MKLTTKDYVIGGGVLTLFGVGLFMGNKALKKAKQKKASKDIQKGTDKNLGINIPAIAQQIGYDLGTAYPWYDPRSATENDDKVLKAVLKVPRPMIPTLKTAYAKRYPGRDLQADLSKNLDDYDEVKYLFE